MLELKREKIPFYVGVVFGLIPLIWAIIYLSVELSDTSKAKLSNSDSAQVIVFTLGGAAFIGWIIAFVTEIIGDNILAKLDKKNKKEE